MAEERQHQALYRRRSAADAHGDPGAGPRRPGAHRRDPEGRLHHAFLFCGPRGTGKTSTARSSPRWSNCVTGPTAEPCGGCTDQCVAIREGTHLDVVEIDAASHGGVEDARELREKAPTAPVQGREKVYIIDEAQRLSREAFDALLKVFEEPPPGVRFVLATTEPHKMPATIVGGASASTSSPHDGGLSTMLQKVAASEGVTPGRLRGPRDRASRRGPPSTRAARPGRRARRSTWTTPRSRRPGSSAKRGPGRARGRGRRRRRPPGACSS